MNIYLDIDGVLLDHNGGKPLKDVVDFLEFVYEMSDGNLYWLSTLKHRSLTHVIDGFQPIMNEELYSLLKKIKNTKWDAYKTEGIDLDNDFLWFDDIIFQFEYKILEKAKKEHCLIKVEENLKEIMEDLKGYC